MFIFFKFKNQKKNERSNTKLMLNASECLIERYLI